MSTHAHLLISAKQYPRHCFANISVDHRELGRWQYRNELRRQDASPLLPVIDTDVLAESLGTSIRHEISRKTAELLGKIVSHFFPVAHFVVAKTAKGKVGIALTYVASELSPSPTLYGDLSAQVDSNCSGVGTLHGTAPYNSTTMNLLLWSERMTCHFGSPHQGRNESEASNDQRNAGQSQGSQAKRFGSMCFHRNVYDFHISPLSRRPADGGVRQGGSRDAHAIHRAEIIRMPSGSIVSIPPLEPIDLAQARLNKALLLALPVSLGIWGLLALLVWELFF